MDEEETWNSDREPGLLYLAFVTLARDTCAKVDLKEMKESPVKCVREGLRYSGGGEEGGEGLLPTGQAGVGMKTRQAGNSKGRRDEFEQLL